MNKRIVFIMITIITIISLGVVAYGATYYDGKSITFNDDKFEIISNEIKIDTTTSKIDNTFLIKNISGEKVEKEMSIQLENAELATNIEELSIIVNNMETKYKKDDKGVYKFKIKAEANAVKKIELHYKTSNNLKESKTIKYSLDGMMGKKIKSFKADIVIAKEDIPLIKGIYPYNYTFEDNTISVKYYDFTVNNLTKDIVIEKDSYSDLLYGREYELSDVDEYIVKNAKDWINNGIDINYKKDLNSSGDVSSEKVVSRLSDIKYNSESEFITLDTCKQIMEYICLIQLEKDNKSSLYYEVNNTIDSLRPLIKKKYNETSKNSTLRNKKICVDYVESEGDKKLYIHKNTTGKEFDSANYVGIKDVQVNEWDILKGKVDWEKIYGVADIVYIGMDIEGNKIEATEKEKIDYVNMMDADMYLRIVIYDGSVNYTKKYQTIEGTEQSTEEELPGIIAYYNNEDRVLAETLVGENSYVEKEKEIKKFDNSDIMNYSQIPTLTRCRAYRVTEDGKYFVKYFGAGGLGDETTLEKTIETSRAQKLIKQNQEKNEATKNSIEEEIKNISIIDDVEEPEEIAEKNDNINEENNENMGKFITDNRDAIVLGTIVFLIIVCLLILINKIKNNKGDKKDERKEQK